ncbi:MAG TPA: cell wall hydrolase, partial [Firmicutes bacterium]|nr:cell wall hydrolase [Bacillota bacterium]
MNSLKSDSIRVGQRLAVPLELVKYYPAGVQLSVPEVEWLAQMIHAEARGEPYIGQVAVGAVIINRMLSPQFPNTLRGV